MPNHALPAFYVSNAFLLIYKCEAVLVPNGLVHGGCTLNQTICDINNSTSSDQPIQPSNTLTPSFNRKKYTIKQAQKLIFTEMGFNRKYKNKNSNRIVNGSPVRNKNEAPFYSRIMSCAYGKKGCSLCGASWISGKCLVTAAHCVDDNLHKNNPEHMVYVHTWRKFGDFGSGYGYQYSVASENVTIHENWSPLNVSNGHDIAIIHVEGVSEHGTDDLIKGSEIYPHFIEIGTVEEYDQLTRCDFFKVFGNGKQFTGGENSEQLLKSGELQFVDCYSKDMSRFQHWQNHSYSNIYDFEPGFDHAVCVNSTIENQNQGYSAICQGDSGGPLVHKDKLFGVLSYNYPPCEAGFPQVFTSLAHMSGWIAENSNYQVENNEFWCYENCRICRCGCFAEEIVEEVIENECFCENGFAAIGGNCTVNGAEICVGCSVGSLVTPYDGFPYCYNPLVVSESGILGQFWSVLGWFLKIILKNLIFICFIF